MNRVERELAEDKEFLRDNLRMDLSGSGLYNFDKEYVWYKPRKTIGWASLQPNGNYHVITLDKEVYTNHECLPTSIREATEAEMVMAKMQGRISWDLKMWW